MLVLIFLLLIAVPIAELYVIVQAAQAFGILETIALLIAISIAGAYLLKQQGLQTWRRLQESLARGEVPTREATDGALIVVGGALLLTPGFLTDVVGLVLLLPPTRAALKGAFRRLLGRWARRRFEVSQRTQGIYSATVVRTRPSTEEPKSPRSLPSEDPRANEGVPPDRG